MQYQAKPCQRCGNLEGWYEKRITYRDQFFDANGVAFSSEGNGELGGKRKYCVQCDADITNKIQSNNPNASEREV